MRYDYRCDHCGKKSERDCPIGKAPKRIRCKCRKMAFRVLSMPRMKRVLTKV